MRTMNLLGAAALLAVQAAAQGTQSYAAMLPDTALPGETYNLAWEFPHVLKVAAYPQRWPDTVDLKRGRTTMRMIGYPPVEGNAAAYRLAVPIHADVGQYNAYAPNGALLETGVTHVPDAAALVPRLTSVPAKGFRGYTYQYLARSMGLAFGPLPDTGAFAPALRYAAFELGRDTLPLLGIVAHSPYRIQGSIQVPPGAGVGAYRLVVQRADGSRTVQDSAFQVWIPEQPVVTGIVPSSLSQGEPTTLGISGLNMDFAVRTGSFVTLDRTRLKEVFIRRGAYVLPAEYPNQFAFGVAQANIWGTFTVPIGTATGKWDLGIVVHGRTDSCLVPEAVDVLPASPPRLTTFRPAEAFAETTLVTVGLFNFSADVRQGKYSLRSGNSAITGAYHSHGGDWVSLRVVPDRTHPPGWYDFHAEMASGETYALPRVFRLLAPYVYVSPMALPQGSDTTALISLRGHAFRTALPPAPGGWENRINARSIGLCRGQACLPAAEMRLDLDSWQARFRVGRDVPAGVYDLEMRILEPDTVVRAARAVVIGPSGYRILTPYTPERHLPYWPLQAESLSVLQEPLSRECDPLLLRIESGPRGLVWEDGFLSWKPAPADTGFHGIRMSGTGSCQEKVFLVAGVAARPQVAIRARGPATAPRLAELAWNTPGELGLVLSHPSAVELRTLTGRLLFDFGRLPAGPHSLVLPWDSRGEGVLLCRVRSDAGEARLKVARFR